MQRLATIDTDLLAQILADHRLVLEQPIAVQLSLAQAPTTPRSLLEVLVHRAEPVVSDVASLHVNWAGELTENWQQEVDRRLATAQLGQNDRLAVELLKIGPVPPEFLSQWVPAHYLLKGLQNPHMPLRYRLKLLNRLAQAPTLEPRLQVAESSETPSIVLEQLMGDLELPIRLAAQANPNCSAEVIALVQTQQEIAGNWETAAIELAELAQSQWDWIRFIVAQNPSSNAATLAQLAADRCWHIQQAVAKNPMTPASALINLANHSDTNIQIAVVNNPNAPEEALHQLFSAHQNLLRQRANLPVSILQRFFDERPPEIPLWNNMDLSLLMQHQPQTPPEILTELVNIDLAALRADTQAKGSPIVTSLDNLVKDRLSFLIRFAEHPNITAAHLEKLSEYEIEGLQLLIAQHPLARTSLKHQLLEQLLLKTYHPSRRYYPSVLITIASNSETPVSILEKMAAHELYPAKLLPEIHLAISSEYPPSETFYRSPVDYMISQLKNNVLHPAGYEVEIDRWMEIVQSSDLWAALTSDDEQIIRTSVWHERVAFRFAEILPDLEPPALARLTWDFCEMLSMINDFIKHDQGARKIAVALVGNPNTPALYRENLIVQLRRPDRSFDRRDNDGDLLLAIIHNPQVPEVERQRWFQILMNDPFGRALLAGDSRTSVAVLQSLAETGEFQEQLVRNPATPESILQQICDNPEERFWYDIVQHQNAPNDLLKRYAQAEPKNFGSIGGRFALVRNHAKLSILERYQLDLNQAAREADKKANEILAKRPNSPYALAKVVEQGDQQAKIMAARNPQTPVAVLQQLARDPNDTIRSVVLENQNLPLETRLAMCDYASVNIRCAIARKHPYRQTPAEVLVKLAHDESEHVRAMVAENSHTPAESLMQLANDVARDVKLKLASNPNTPIDVLMQLGLEESIFDARNPHTPAEVLEQVVNHMLGHPHQHDPRWSRLESTNKSLTQLLKHPVQGSQMPAHVLERLADHHYPSVRYRVAQHPNTPTSALEKLANDDYVPTVRAIVDNRNTPPEILAKLAEMPDTTTHISIIRHPNTPSSVLAQMVQNSMTSGNAPHQSVDSLKSALPADQYDVLRELASKPNLPLESLEILARREFVGPVPNPQSILPPRTDDDVVRALVYNPSLTARLLNILAQDPCKDVRLALIRHPNITQEIWQKLAQDHDSGVRRTIAVSHQTPIAVLELLAADAESDVRQALACNTNAPPNVLTQLAQDVELHVRQAIALNPSTPLPVLEQLAQDEKIEVRRAVAQNKITPSELRVRLSDLMAQSTNSPRTSPTLRGLPRLYNPQTDDLAELLVEYSQSENDLVRFVALLHPLTPIAVLEEGAKSLSWFERYAVAENPNTPAESRQQLTQDVHRIVRAAASYYN